MSNNYELVLTPRIVLERALAACDGHATVEQCRQTAIELRNVLTDPAAALNLGVQVAS